MFSIDLNIPFFAITFYVCFSAKLPKNVEPGSVADPERWLPLRERSTFKGRRRRNKREVGKGTQGGSSAALMAEL